MSGDCTLAASGAVRRTKTNNASFVPSVTTDTTNVTNFGSGTLAVARGGVDQTAFFDLCLLTEVKQKITATSAGLRLRLNICDAVDPRRRTVTYREVNDELRHRPTASPFFRKESE
jgi:hypothetical protein